MCVDSIEWKTTVHVQWAGRLTLTQEKKKLMKQLKIHYTDPVPINVSFWKLKKESYKDKHVSWL